MCTKTDNFKFMSHRKCEYFPCHNVSNPDNFNCLFCYCPLYALGEKCGGDFTYTDNGIKDCSNCMIPHSRNAFDYILSKSDMLMEMAKRK